MTQPRQLLDRPARREAILRGAADAFAVKGFAATSMEDVAAAAGITKLIVYRHFESKQELYDAVLERVADRLRDEWVQRLAPGRAATGAVHSLLAVAREDPAGFTLLWRHAAREPQFAPHADDIRARGVRAAARVLAPAPLPDDVKAWAASTVVTYLVTAVLGWLEQGSPDRDGAFAEMLTRSLPALVGSWAGASPGNG
ncbi:MAG TPA: TetR/AcrR family transcriptional regulator [Acidimicrobiales bacterium]|nr:TetR/AcrR family transcriptional regulator [Acidimicrobiales bacterium]